MICRKAKFTVSVSAVMLPDANYLSSRAQNRGFCALLGFGTQVFGPSEYKKGYFVLGVAPTAMSQMTLGDANTGALPLQRR